MTPDEVDGIPITWQREMGISSDTIDGGSACRMVAW